MTVFLHDDPLLTGVYFHGHYRWTQDRYLERASLICRPPASGRIRIGLEVDGVAAGPELYVLGSSRSEVRFSVPLRVTVPAGAQLRFKVLEFTGAEAAAGHSAAITLTDLPLLTDRVLPVPLTVRYVNGAERLTLFHYASGVFTAVAPTAGRAEIVSSVDALSWSVGGTLAFRLYASGELFCSSLTELGSAIAPRLEFLVGDRVIGWTAGGRFQAASFIEATPVAGQNQFEFFVDGALRATLSAEALTAASFSEWLLGVQILTEDYIPILTEDGTPILADGTL